jgi:hypothetical protein
MKDIKQIRESYNLITEKEEAEDRKLATLVRAGLYDAKKLPALKKALEKSADKMTGQEKRMLLNLLDSLINQVVGSDQVFRKVKQNVQHMNEAREDYYSKLDPRAKAEFPKDKDMPSVLILKRKAIRVYPDNQKVALYYSQALDKYVTIPFSDVQTGLNEETEEEKKKKNRGVGSIPVNTSNPFVDQAKKKARERARRPRKGDEEDTSLSAIHSSSPNIGGTLGIKAGLFFHNKKPQSQKDVPASSAPKTEPVSVPAKTPVAATPAPKSSPVKPRRSRRVVAKSTTTVKPPARRSPKATAALINKTPNVQYSTAALKHAGMATESFKHKLQMMREEVADFIDRFAVMHSGGLWDTEPRGLSGGGAAGRRAGVDVLKGIQKQPTLNKPANQNIINKSKADVLKAVKKKVDQKRPAADAKAAPTSKAVQQTDLKPPPASSSGTFNKDIPSKDRTVSDMSSFLQKRKLEKDIKSDAERTTRYKTKLAAQKQAKTGFGTSTGSVSNPPAPKQDKPAPSPGLKTGPSFEKTGRGNAPSTPARPAEAPKQPKKTEELPTPYSPVVPVPVKKDKPATEPDKKQVTRPATEPRDKTKPYKSNAEKAADATKVQQAQATSPRKGPDWEKKGKDKDRSPRRRFPIAAAAAAAAGSSAMPSYKFEKGVEKVNAWDLKQNKLPASLERRVQQANYQMLKQTNESAPVPENIPSADSPAHSAMPTYSKIGSLKPGKKNPWQEKNKPYLPPALEKRQQIAAYNSMRQTNESVITTLQNMIDNNINEQTVSINEQEININNTVAKKIMYVYESVNSTNKKKMEKMMNESAESFTKVLTFAIRQ